jgi:dienelactone hydrolase
VAALAVIAGAALGQEPEDRRLGPPKILKGYFPFTPPADLKAWEARRQEVREQVLVANGLWPLPPKTPLNAVIHGKIDRGEYTVEKVFFASHPGHYVTGNLYRPKGKEGRLPGVLCPHGHWANGRFFEASEKEAKKQIAIGAEKTVEGARYPLQARCAQLARMGCVVFHYDMVGNADSRQIGHATGFADPEGELRLQSAMGLQTWNSIRALDFLLDLPDVDAKRIGVTGASGGGTQTFILCAIDDRPAAAFPAVMVSTGMQGGCVCENASYLRIGTGNVELAALFAPRPLAMSGADDWTIEIETKGLPQLKELYRLYRAEDKVAARTWKEFKHNYNQVAREFMYSWFNKHLKLGHPEPVAEKPFVPVPPKELSVFNAKHPLPKDAVDVHGLRRYLTATSAKQLAALMPRDRDRDSLAEFRRVVGPALRVMIHDTLPPGGAVEVVAEKATDKEETLESGKVWLSRKGAGEAVPAAWMKPADFNGTVVVWVHPDGAESVRGEGFAGAAREILKRKAAVLAVSSLRSGKVEDKKFPRVNEGYAGYTFGYNRPLLAERVHDVLTAVAHARDHMKAKTIHLVGFGRAGPWAVLARALCGDSVARTAADLDGFRFERVLSNQDEMMLPGALRYGGLPALAALCAPYELLLHNAEGTGAERWLPAAYSAAGAVDRLQREGARMPPERVVAWLLR